MKQTTLTLTYTALLEGTVRNIIPRDFHFHILTTHLMYALQTMRLPNSPKCACLAVFYNNADLSPYGSFEMDSRGSIMGVALDKHPELAVQVFEGRVFVADFPKDLFRVIRDLEERVDDFSALFDPVEETGLTVSATLAHLNFLVTLYCGK